MVVWLPFVAPGPAVAQGHPSAASCRRAIFEGEVLAGKGFERPLGNGLEVMVEPLASGWIFRVVPSTGPRGKHDYAELATPPYQSVNPLLLTTDFSFRSQDVVAWNPRQFHYIADPATFTRMQAAYTEYMSPAGSSRAQGELVSLAAKASTGTIRILDARLIPGTADQAQMASMVASHFATTMHTIEQPADGRAMPLGRVSWMRFRIELDLPPRFLADPGVVVLKLACH